MPKPVITCRRCGEENVDYHGHGFCRPCYNKVYYDGTLEEWDDIEIPIPLFGVFQKWDKQMEEDWSDSGGLDMKIGIDDFELHGDGRNISLFKIRKKGSDDECRVLIGHFPNLLTCLNRLSEESLSDSDSNSIDLLRADLHQVSERILSTLEQMTEQQTKKFPTQVNRLVNGQIKPTDNTKPEPPPSRYMKESQEKPKSVIKRIRKSKETLSTATMTTSRQKELTKPPSSGFVRGTKIKKGN